MEVRHRCLLCSFLALSLACKHAPERDLSEIKLSKSEPAGDCEELGEVFGHGGGGVFNSAEGKLIDAEDELREEAADLGATHVVMEAATADAWGTSISGRALRCAASSKETVVPGAPAKTVPVERSRDERLRELKQLFDDGLITPEDYEKRKSEILDEV